MLRINGMVLKKAEILNHQLSQFLTSTAPIMDKSFFKLGEVAKLDVIDQIYSKENMISYNPKLKFNIETLTTLSIKAHDKKKKEEY